MTGGRPRLNTKPQAKVRSNQCIKLTQLAYYFRMAGGGCTFILLRSLCLMTLVSIDFGFGMNFFRVVPFESYKWRSLCAICYAAQ